MNLSKKLSTISYDVYKEELDKSLPRVINEIDETLLKAAKEGCNEISIGSLVYYKYRVEVKEYYRKQGLDVHTSIDGSISFSWERGKGKGFLDILFNKMRAIFGYTGNI